MCCRRQQRHLLPIVAITVILSHLLKLVYQSVLQFVCAHKELTLCDTVDVTCGVPGDFQLPVNNRLEGLIILNYFLELN